MTIDYDKNFLFFLFSFKEWMSHIIRDIFPPAPNQDLNIILTCLSVWLIAFNQRQNAWTNWDNMFRGHSHDPERRVYNWSQLKKFARGNVNFLILIMHQLKHAENEKIWLNMVTFRAAATIVIYN